MNAAIYARKSTDQAGIADEQKSVARQVEHARAFAASKGWSADDALVFVDDGISGAEFANRPGFLRLMNALKPRPAFQVLIMSEESRLGREAIETAYALKQIIQAGVRVWFYLENRERTLETPTDKLLMSVTAFADELEREKARQRTYDAMQRKAKAGQVTGGRLFGYTNVDIPGAAGKRSHVERRIQEPEADVIRRIFRLCAVGHGMKGIAKLLNDDHAPSPRAQRGRSQSWAPSSVREVLMRDTYRGVITWNKSRKRNTWGQHRQTARPSSEWLQVPAPHLAIVSEAEWRAAHTRLDAARAIYLRGTRGLPFGRPPVGSPSKYLLTAFADCGLCGSTMKALSRQHGQARAFYYGCAGYHDRGKSVCTNGASLPMDDANAIVVEVLLDDLLAPDMVEEAIDGALALIIGDDDGAEARRRREELEKKIRAVEGQRNRLAEAIATGGELAGLLDALKAREIDLSALRAQRDRLQVSRGPQRDPGAVRVDLVTMAADWRRVLAGEPEHARPLLASLLVGRVRFTPAAKRHEWELKGSGTLAGLFSRLIVPSVPLGVASPAGFDTQWKVDFGRKFRAA